MSPKVAIVNFKKSNYTKEVDTDGTQFGTSEYSYLTDNKDLKVGDIVVVDTKYGLELAQFVRYTESLSYKEKATKWIISKVDLKEHTARIERLEKQQALLDEMRRIQNTAMELDIFTKLAETNPNMKELLDKYNSLS